MSIIREPLVIEVRSNDMDQYSIPGAAEPEDALDVMANLEPRLVEYWGSLTSWGPWRSVYRIIDEDGLVRWYFGGDLPVDRALREGW